MSALTDLFTAMANKIRSKTGTATTYTPLEMVSDGIDDVYDAGYAAGGGGATGTPITPSNSSPASMTSGTTYEAQANGYAIASYSSATPSNANPFFMQEDEYYKLSQGWAGGYLIGTYDQITPSNSSPVSLSSGSIYKMGGAGKAVASVTDATPSNSSPVSLSSGTVYKMGGAGKAVASVTDITPSSSAPSIASGTIYKAGGGGYAIDNYTSISQAQLQSGVYFSSGFKKMASSGYAYATEAPKVKTGTFTTSGTTTTKVTTGFQPKYLAVLRITSGTTQDTLNIYDADVTTSYAYIGLSNSGSLRYALPSTTQYRIASIDSDGFTFNKHSGTATMYYFAIG